MKTPDELDRLLPLARPWAKSEEKIILEHGAPLRESQVADARLAGVKDVGRVRMLVVDRILLPDDPVLAEAARRVNVITPASRAMTIGHGIIIRADSYQDRELLLHALVHVAQCERSGGLDTFVEEYMLDRHTSADFTVGSIEDEARQTARQICADHPASA